MPGKLIVIDGLDGSGKSTQSEAVAELLRKQGTPVRLISFPDYGEESSALVRMYLNGELSASPDGVNAYAASSFYAVDRYASYKKHWEADYLSGHTILATRYVSSNAIHQMCKLPREEWDGLLRWLSDFEYDKLGLPRPDRTIILDIPVELSQKRLSERYHGYESKKDIHESNIAYMTACRKSALYAAKKCGWDVISCCGEDGHIYSQEEVTQMLLNIIGEVIGSDA